MVGMNFEDPMNPNVVSTLTFGHFDGSAVWNGLGSLNYFGNIGKESWAMAVMDPIMYNGEHLYETSFSKVAHVDTGSPNIRIPHYAWDKLLQIMQK